MTTKESWAFQRRISGADIQRLTDLHQAHIDTDEGPEPLRDFGLSAQAARVDVVFQGIEQRLIAEIEQADVVVGCVAWLTSPRVLGALAERQGVSIIVQKEDFLRPDYGADRDSRWRRQLRDAYKRLPSMIRYSFPTLISHLSVASDPAMDPVRCVGNYNASKTAMPRSHHKFVVFCRVRALPDDWHVIEPYAVWTGSFNFTETACRSFENAVLLHDREIAMAYLNEYSQIAAISEPLDWSSEWIEPEWRIGT